MKKTIVLIAVAMILISVNAFSQNPVSQSKTQLNLGTGFSGWGIPLYIGIDYWVHPDITIGGEISYRSYRDHWKDTYYHHNIVGVSGNGNYHFNRLLNIPQKWDFYAGPNLGFYVWSSPNDYFGDHSSRMGLGAQIGGRYYFSDRIGLNLEFGGGNAFSGGKFGVTIKI